MKPEDSSSRLAQIEGSRLHVAIDDFLQSHLYRNPKYSESKRLTACECQGFSQFGEDGIIREIFTRIGTGDRFFVEFGVQDGLESNSTLLIHDGWRGVWFESDEKSAREIEGRFGRLIERGTLKFRQVALNAENVESRFAACGVPSEFDLLSVDVDGNDYWIWKAIESFRPRVVVIEYNAIFPPPVRWVMPYDPAAKWTGNSNHSASLKSLELLGRAKGYSLVGCSFAGVNAFFVRNDLLGDLFEAPFTAEHHYEPPRFFLIHKAGHPRTFSESGEPTDAE